MKKLLFIFATILIALSAQAQTRYQLQAGDIVTISRVNGTTRNYLTVNENNGLVVHNEPNDNSLWVIHTCSYASSKNQYTLKHYKTGGYLQITGKKPSNKNITDLINGLMDLNLSLEAEGHIPFEEYEIVKL